MRKVLHPPEKQTGSHKNHSPLLTSLIIIPYKKVELKLSISLCLTAKF